jgi:MFS family permease
LKFIRVRGDKLLTRQMLDEGELGPIEPRTRALEPYSLTAVLTPVEPIRKMLDILRRDKAFRVYQIAQMFSGAANLLIDPILVLIFANQLRMNYTQATAMLDIVPIVLSLFTVTIWARLYDRWGLPKYRVINGGFWTVRMILTAVAVVCTQYILEMPRGYAVVVGFFIFAQVLNGIAQGGGGIAWNLGHLHFAKPEEAELYMGLHATLTGVRGWLGFVGAPLYFWAGWPVFAVAAVMSLVGFVLYFHGMTTRFGLGSEEAVVEAGTTGAGTR